MHQQIFPSDFQIAMLGTCMCIVHPPHTHTRTQRHTQKHTYTYTDTHRDARKEKLGGILILINDQDEKVLSEIIFSVYCLKLNK